MARTAFGVAVGLAVHAAGQTITVSTTQDVDDFGGLRRVDDLPGPDGVVSFREAVAAANNTPGAQIIEFAIPMSDWWFVNDMAVLRFEVNGVVVTDDETTIDFTTQTDFTGDTNPNGPEVGIYGVHPNWLGTDAITIAANDCVVRGLGEVWNRVSVAITAGERNRIVGCQTPSVKIGDSLGPEAPSANVVGGTTPEDRNVLGDLKISCYANDNVVIGNEIGSIDIAGSLHCVYPERNRIGGPTPEERNVITDTGGLSNQGCPVGAGIRVHWARGTLIEGNFIGVASDGVTRTDIGHTGIEVSDAVDTTIRGNLIAGQRIHGTRNCSNVIAGQAILLRTFNADNVGVIIEGNLIGTDASGENGVTTLHGIVVRPVSGLFVNRDIRIGGLGEGQGNLIAFTERAGISVVYPAIDTEIAGNSIHSNGLLGIDLAPHTDVYLAGDGVTLNDPLDDDTVGGNSLQNFPVLVSASVESGGVRVVGSLHSKPSRAYRIEAFASPACDDSGHGEGLLFLGAATVMTDDAGNVSFDMLTPVEAPSGWVASATATDLTPRATSEFAACIEIIGPECPADLTGTSDPNSPSYGEPDGVLDSSDFFYFLDQFAAANLDVADMSGSSSPGSGMYGVPDGVLDGSDFFYFLDLFDSGCP